MRFLIQMKKINIITLGCAKNKVDSEHVAAQLAAAGWEILYDSDRTDAKTVVINTCGFIGDAKQESIDTILNAVAAKQAGKIDHLFVMGCLSERYADELREEIPEVDKYFGIKNFEEVVAALGVEHCKALETERACIHNEHITAFHGVPTMFIAMLAHPDFPTLISSRNTPTEVSALDW